MARSGASGFNARYIQHFQPDGVTFNVFTTEELKKLCVLKVVTPLMLDTLGHPLPGGLYDKRMGPMNERSDPCGTCQKNVFFCPGHFGYIELPLPVVNPLFYKTIGTILRMTCLSCYNVQIPAYIKQTIVFQMRLLSYGLITEALEIEVKVMKLFSEFEEWEDISSDSRIPIEDYEKLVKEQEKLNNGKHIVNKNTETVRNQLVNGMLREIKSRSACMFCKEPTKKISVTRSRVVIVNKFKNKEKSKDGSSVMTDSVNVPVSKYISPEESRRFMREIWKEEKDLLQALVSVLANVKSEHPTDIFYFDIIPVPPPNIRPVNVLHQQVIEHQQSQTYKTILQNTILLRVIIQVVQNKGDDSCIKSAEAKSAYKFSRGTSAVEKLNYCWEEIQNDVNSLVDSDLSGLKDRVGLKQIIEKKMGVIRKHMMGKRVNFAARSVITPDPNLNIDEIGIPEVFAKHLTYPVPVTTWNVEELRKMIENGPNVHPGASLVEFEDGSVVKISSDRSQQETLLKRLLTPDETSNRIFKGVKTVHRHLITGDILLLNRQPTLHKPSIMAHSARILKGEKTLRLHYANCKAYNADFDGDEMNAHFPQNELARSEGYFIANVSNQYLVPKDGSPLSGLIQDHMIAGVRMSLRGRFFNCDDYQQFVYQALSYKISKIKLLRPAIIKPIELWSGKQILSTIIINILPNDLEPINLTASSKIPAKAWASGKPRPWKAGGTPFKSENTMSEAEVIIRGGELLVGILDKTHYGSTPYSLVHCIYELYGGTYAIRCLSSFAKLFTRFLQNDGFTLGVHDILTVPSADKERQKIIKESRKIGRQAVTTALDLPIETPINEIVEKLEEQYATNPKLRTIIDREYKSALDSYTNRINKACLPAGLICKFPQNNLQLMVQSGAKGSTVNTMQISCLLGQIELEGKRPPIMISRKSLPSFPIFELTPRAGGFIDGRFMTGIQPQEFFFHCMAGREGLIDTAVKTSRSGYLQRCLIKHLEGLHVGYDMTVRNSDQSVIQFLYGEDGMDIAKVQFLNEKQMQFLSDNKKVVLNKELLKMLKGSEGQAELKEYYNKVNEWKENNGDETSRKSAFLLFCKMVEKKAKQKIRKSQLTDIWHDADKIIKDGLIKQCAHRPDPVNSVFQSDHHFGSLNERLEELLQKSESKLDKKSKKGFANMVKLKAMQSFCAPGEPVGLLAAQSIGEPSTQMTLNTFHFAGRGEMNVTLGIPRLREILMMASKSIKTPSMEIPFLPVPNLNEKAELLRKQLSRVVVADVLENVEVTVELKCFPVGEYTYTLKFNFLPRKYYKNDYVVKPKLIISKVRKVFFAHLFSAIKKFGSNNSNLVTSGGESARKKTFGGNEENDEEQANEAKQTTDMLNDESSDEENEDEEDAKISNKFNEVRETQDPDSEEEPPSDIDEALEENEGEVINANGLPLENDGQEKISKDAEGVLVKHKFATNYVEDTEKYLWSQLTFSLPLHYKKLDMTAILRNVASKCVIWETPNIRKAITYMKNDILTLRTDGININEMFKHRDLLNLNKLYSNDIHNVAATYGIEAAMKIIVKEVQDVFNVYGIKVDPRHLSLIADYMTFNGTFEPLSRKGMETSASPLQQMSFESSLTFLKAAATRGKSDDLENPSSSLMLGKACSVGTGRFTLLQKMPKLATL